MLHSIPTPLEERVGGGFSSPYKDNPAEAPKVLTQPSITLFMECPDNKDKPRAEIFSPAQSSDDLEYKTGFDERQHQGNGYQDDDRIIQHDVRRDDKPPENDEYKKDNAEDVNDVMSTAPSVVGKPETRCEDNDKKEEDILSMKGGTEQVNILMMSTTTNDEGDVKRSMGDEHRVMLDKDELDNDDELEQCRMKQGQCEVYKTQR